MIAIKHLGINQTLALYNLRGVEMLLNKETDKLNIVIIHVRMNQISALNTPLRLVMVCLFDSMLTFVGYFMPKPSL